MSLITNIEKNRSSAKSHHNCKIFRFFKTLMKDEEAQSFPLLADVSNFQDTW